MLLDPRSLLATPICPSGVGDCEARSLAVLKPGGYFAHVLNAGWVREHGVLAGNAREALACGLGCAPSPPLVPPPHARLRPSQPSCKSAIWFYSDNSDNNTKNPDIRRWKRALFITQNVKGQRLTEKPCEYNETSFATGCPTIERLPGTASIGQV